MIEDSNSQVVGISRLFTVVVEAFFIFFYFFKLTAVMRRAIKNVKK